MSRLYIDSPVGVGFSYGSRLVNTTQATPPSERRCVVSCSDNGSGSTTTFPSGRTQRTLWKSRLRASSKRAEAEAAARTIYAEALSALEASTR